MTGRRPLNLSKVIKINNSPLGTNYNYIDKTMQIR